jgi:Tfp pilus assembly protein PilN
MIKINLLQAPEAPTVPGGPEERPAVPATQQVQVFLGALLAAGAIAGLLYWVWSHKIQRLNAALAEEKREAARLTAIQVENQRYQQQLADIEARVRMVKMLDAARVGPVQLLDALGEAVNRSQGVYLLNVNADGPRVVVDGMADAVESIVAFVSALKHGDRFGDVQLRQFYQDDRDKRMSFKFNLDFVFQSPVAAGSPQPAVAAAGAPATPRS